MLLVCGVRKLQWMTNTVLAIVRTFVTNVNRMNLATRGTFNDVGGRIFDTRSKNTISARRMEIDIMIFSLASAGRY